MTPSLPVALAILSFLSTPAAAAPDFAVMRECGPEHYARYQKASGFEKGDPAELAKKLELINGALDSAGSFADSISRPGSDAPALPPGCALNEAKIKDEVYGGLADLRRRINDKAADALPEEEKEPTRILTAIEGELDAAMGEADNFAELKAKIRGIVGKVTAAEGGAPESVKPRVLRVKKRIGAILVRISEKQGAGASSFDQAIPAEVLALEAKRLAGAKKRTGGFKGDAFGDKTDDLSGPQTAENRNEGNRGGAVTAEIQGSGADHRRALTEANGGGRAASTVPGRKKPRVESAVDTAEIDEDTDPDEPGSSVLTEAVTNSATKPLGGAVSPPSAAAAASYAERKKEARRALQTIADMPANDVRSRSEKSMAIGELNESRGFQVDVDMRSGEGVLKLTKNYKTRTFHIVNGKLPDVPKGDLTPEEEVALDWELEQLKRKNQN